MRQKILEKQQEINELRQENKELVKTKKVPARELAAKDATIKFLCEALDSIARATENKRARTRSGKVYSVSDFCKEHRE